VQSEVVGPWWVTLIGEFKRPGTYMITKGERLSSVVRRAGGLTDRGYPKAAVFTRKSVRQSEKQKIDEFVLVQQEALLAEAAAITAGTAAGAEQGVAMRESLAQRQALLRVLAQRAVVGRVVLRVGPPEKFEGSESDLVLEDGDTLTIPVKPSSVLVLGSVRNPTALLHDPGVSAEEYVNRAGGLTKQADSDEVYIVKADGSTIIGYMKVRDLEPGDTVVVPPSTEPKYLKLPLWRDVATIFGQFGLAIAGIAAAFK
jgi:protein involved in polysaccharide export with SLBB domain